MSAASFTVDAGNHDRSQAPVTVALPSLAGAGGVLVRDVATSVTTPAQVVSGPGGAAIAFIIEAMDPHETRTYEVVDGETQDHVALADDGRSVAICVGGAEFTTHLYSAEYVRPHFFPVLGPEGRLVTETAASDHVHHRSLYVAYGEVNGVDCWSEVKGHGRVELRKPPTVTSGPVFGETRTESTWCAADGSPLMTDDVCWRIYNLPSARRIIEAEILFHASEGDVEFGDTKEGGIISLRVAPSMHVTSTGKIENSFGGVNEDETWGKPAQWCDYSGYVDGTHLGIAVLDHNTNPRHPCHWHVRNYGLMTTNVFGRGTFSQGVPLLDGDGAYRLAQGDSLRFRYQVVVHAGDAQEADMNGAYHNFINPPEADPA